MNLITLKVFDNYIDAHILRAKLESDDIVCYLFDENIVALNPLYNLTVGGIKEKIDNLDLEKAKLILREINETPYTNETNEPLTCPFCASVDVQSGYRSMKNVGGFFAMIVSFFLVVFPFFSKRVYRCNSCKMEFKQK